MTHRGVFLTALTGSLVVIAAASPLRASGGVSVYAVIEKVAVESHGTSAPTVRIWGAFSLAQPTSADGVLPAGSYGNPWLNVYGPVQKGYLFYSCPRDAERLCLEEWNDLASVAGTRQIVAFGANLDTNRFARRETVRAASEPPARPDTYWLNLGVVRMGPPNTPGATLPLRGRMVYGVYAELARALLATIDTK